MSVPESDKKHIRSLLIEGRKIEAIKFIKTNYGLPLKEAKRLIDLVDLTIGDDEYQATTPRSSTIPKVIGGVFLLAGIALLAITVYVYSLKEDLVSKGIPGQAVVISTPSKPVFEYVYQDQVYQYQSDVESNPPSYEIGEAAEIFINPDNPNEILVNSFTDRWLVVTIVGSMGVIFFLAGFFAFVAGSRIATRRI